MNKIKFIIPLLIPLCLSACSSKDFRHIEVKDHFNILKEPVEEYVLSGNLVDVVLVWEDHQTVAIRVDGEIWAPNPSRYSEVDQYAVVTFKMPDHDVVVQTTIDGCFTDKCEEGHHDYKSHVSETNGKTYYECSICGHIYHD